MYEKSSNDICELGCLIGDLNEHLEPISRFLDGWPETGNFLEESQGHGCFRVSVGSMTTAAFVLIGRRSIEGHCGTALLGVVRPVEQPVICSTLHKRNRSLSRCTGPKPATHGNDTCGPKSRSQMIQAEGSSSSADAHLWLAGVEVGKRLCGYVFEVASVRVGPTTTL